MVPVSPVQQYTSLSSQACRHAQGKLELASAGMTQCRILGKLRYAWGPNFKVVLLMILVCQVHYYNIGSTLHKYECREMDIWLDICDIWFYKKGP